MATRLSLAQQIAELELAAPTKEFDPENVEVPIEERGNDLDAGRSHYVDVGPSTLRKAHHSVTDPKYGSVRISRKQLMDDDEEDDDDDERMEPSDEDEHSDDYELKPGSNDGEEQNEGSSHSESQEIAVESEQQKVETHHDDFSAALKHTREQDRRKGVAVAQQLATWDSLLDARIRLQKFVSASNRLHAASPEAEALEDTSLTKMLQEATLLSEDLFELQEMMLSTACEMPPRKKRRIESVGTLEDYEDYFRGATKHASDVEHCYHSSMIHTLTKWSTRIQAVAPSVLLQSNRKSFSKSSQTLKSAVQLIDESLNDQKKLLERTQIWRGKGSRLGIQDDSNAEDERDEQIFDDTDFYQQLLRDVIDSKNGVDGRDDWIAVQKHKKAKKKVDTKASKGRKIRYDVHEKLQHFMVPINVLGAWHEQQIDELFGSILGLGLENALNVEQSAIVAEDVTDPLQDGFRVFG